MDISFIIVNYNTKYITEDCIQSILNNESLNYFNYEILVVDNDSKDNSIEYLTIKDYANTKIISNNINNGFGCANNLGVKNSKGEILVLTNSDTILNDTDIKSLIHIIRNKEDVGVLSCKILNKDKSIQTLGFKFPSILNEVKLNLLFWNYNFMKKIRLRNYQNKGLIEVDWVSGSFMIIKKKYYELIQGFDEKIFMYAEDLDLCYRLKKIGKQSYVYDQTSIYHLQGKSGNNTNKMLKRLLERRETYYYVLQKNNLISRLRLIKATYLFQALILVGVKKIVGMRR